MGNIKSFCCKDNASDIDDREERSRILSNDNCNTSTNDLYNNSTTSALSQHETTSYGSIHDGNHGKTMEQSALDRIYQKMAANVIDIAPGESMVIQQAEFMERQRAYQAKLSQIKTPLPLKSKTTKQANNSQDHIFNITAPSAVISNVTFSTVPNASNIAGNASPQHLTIERRGVEFEPISDFEVQLIDKVSKKSIQAIKGLKINSDEQVVTQFKP